MIFCGCCLAVKNREFLLYYPNYYDYSIYCFYVWVFTCIYSTLLYLLPYIYDFMSDF